jgi:hypothetical protein
MDGIKIYVDAWDPSYGAGLDLAENGGPTVETSAQLRTDIELEPGAWRPLAPAADARSPDLVLLVDGVRRIDARIWVEEPDGTLHPGLAASYAAGVVRCDLRRGSAEVAGARVARGFFTPSPDAADITAANARYSVHRVAGTEPEQVVQTQLRQLEMDVSALARATTETLPDPTEDDLLVLDGPLFDRARLPRTLGFVKTHRIQYLPPALTLVVGRLAPGQRTPIFQLGGQRPRYTWYLKLPGPAGSPWAGVVRLEVSADLPRVEAIRLADVSTVTLPRFASSPYKDARAPQNLTPIAGLERRLRGMLGDQRLLVRSLSAVAHRRAA